METLIAPKMTLEEILESDYREFVEVIEWGATDAETAQKMKNELWEKTGWAWMD